jgi:hypothetical protein
MLWLRSAPEARVWRLLCVLFLWLSQLPAQGERRAVSASHMTFARWRRIHRTASGLIAILGALHCVLTFALYASWSPDAVWFFGTGLSLVLLALMNWAHVGFEPCPLPTARAVRYANVVYALFGAAAVVAVPEPQAFVLAAAIAVQAVAGHFTLRTDV